MKFSSLSKFVGAGLIAASLSVVPLSAQAQAQVNETYQNEGVETQADYNNDFDWGWLGLLGLLGLAGLGGRKRQETVYHEPTAYRDRDVTVPPDYRR